jgi:PilZ domain
MAKEQHPIAPPEGALERRVDDRQKISVLINAGIYVGDQDALCRIRNMSEQGVMIECRLQLAVGQDVRLCVRSGRVFEGMVRWALDGRAGIEVPDGITLSLLTEAMKPIDLAFRGAQPSFARTARALISFDHRNIRCQISEISLNHVRLSGIEGVADQQVATVTIDGLGSSLGKINWAPVRGAYGDDPDSMILLFTQPLHFRLLDDWLDMTSERDMGQPGAIGTMIESDMRRDEL